MTPQLLIAGHIVKDITDEGWQPGGGALYASAQAAKLGVDTAVVTACEAEIRPEELVPGVSWHVVQLDHSIRFENTYVRGQRNQRVIDAGRPIVIEDIPEDWRYVPRALLTPVFHDVDASLPSQLVKNGTSVGIGAQGWLRGRAGDRVQTSPVQLAPAWLHGDVVFLSEEDVTDPDNAAQWRERVAVVVVTRGRDGFTVWDDAGRHDVAPVRACEVDPTGAGDIFATAYVVRYGETRDVLVSARFAAVAAAISVEGRGIESVATREEIEARLVASGVCC